MRYELAEADAAGGGAAAATEPASQPEGSTAASPDPGSADAGTVGSAVDAGDDLELETAEPEELDDEVVGAVLRRYKDRPSVREQIEREATEQAERIVAQREEAARVRPDYDPGYVRLAQQANGSLEQLDQLIAHAAEVGERPDPEAVKGLMGNYGRFVEYREQRGAYAVFTSLLNHLAIPARTAVQDDGKLVERVDAQYADALQMFERLASPQATPDNRRKAFGELVIRGLRAYGELKLAEGAAKERARVERERRDRDLIVRENERLRQHAETQASEPGEPRPRRAPRTKPTVIGPKDLNGDWKSDREKLRAAGIRI